MADHADVMTDATRWDDEATARRILTDAHSIAVVGCSPEASRPCHGVTRHLMDSGYTIYPVNPRYEEILGVKCYPDIASIPEAVDVVDIFRRSDAAGAHVDEAIAAGAKAVWLQLGVIDEAAAQRAEAAGLDVIMDRCTAEDHRRFRIGPRAQS